MTLIFGFKPSILIIVICRDIARDAKLIDLLAPIAFLFTLFLLGNNSHWLGLHYCFILPCYHIMYFRPEFYSCTPQNHIEFVGPAVHNGYSHFCPWNLECLFVGFKHLNPLRCLRLMLLTNFEMHKFVLMSSQLPLQFDIN